MTAVRLYSRAGEHGALWHAIAGLGLVLDPGDRPVYVRGMRWPPGAALGLALAELTP